MNNFRTQIGLFALAILTAIFACPLLAFAESVDELETVLADKRLEYEQAIFKLEEIQDQLEIATNELDEVVTENSSNKQQLDDSIVSLYKMTKNREAVFEMFLDSDSLDQAIHMFEAYCSTADHHISVISERSNNIASLQGNKANLEQSYALAASNVAIAQEHMEYSEQELNNKVTEIQQLKENSDNSRLAWIACSMAYSKKVRNSDGYAGTSSYIRAWQNVLPNDRIPNGRSCDRGVMIPIKIAGIDPEFPVVCSSQFSYMSDSDQWMDLGVWNGDTSYLKPGDVLVSIAGIDGASYDHSCMYVGYDIAQSVYENVLKGTDADLGRPLANAVFASASYQWGSVHGRALCICSDGENGSHVFRCVKPDQDNTYAFLR